MPRPFRSSVSRRSRPFDRLSTWVCSLVFVLGGAGAAVGQVDGILPSPPPGVRIDAGGVLSRQEIDDRAELAAMRKRAKAAQAEAKDAKLGFVSLPKAFAAAKAAFDAGKPVPDDVKYLGGLTRIDVLLVYPEADDLVIGGPAEPVRVIDDQRVVGRRTGRPVLRLDDLAVSMRVVRDVGRGSFGCRLDPDPASPGRISVEMQRLARATRAERIKAVRQAIGPQKVSFFGKLPDDSRLALATLAADYELKRYGLGLARSTVPDLGNGVDATRQAVNMWWFELAYEPILVSPAGDAYGLRGPRLKVQAGNFKWDPKGATPKAYEFAKRMTQRIETLATVQPLLADLQNVGDLTVVSALVHRDRLDKRANWDASWVLREDGYRMEKLAVPKTAEALANYTNGAIAAGGVTLLPAGVLAATPEKDEKGTLAAAKAKLSALRRANPDAGIAVVER